MFIKIYEYRIREDREALFLSIQEKAASIYQAHMNCEIMLLKCLEDKTKWLEISRYNSQDDYLNGMKRVNEVPAIQYLFKEFESCLVSDVLDIQEQNYLMKLRK